MGWPSFRTTQLSLTSVYKSCLGLAKHNYLAEGHFFFKPSRILLKGFIIFPGYENEIILSK